MAVNKVVYDGNTLIDLTNDTVTADTLVSGATAHNAAGVSITGTASYLPTSGGTITGDLSVSGAITSGGNITSGRDVFAENGWVYSAQATTLFGSGTLSKSGTWYWSASTMDKRVYKSWLVLLRTYIYSGSNLYMSYVFPTAADVWHLFIPYGGSDYFRCSVTITESGNYSGLQIQIDSGSAYSTYAFVYGMG